MSEKQINRTQPERQELPEGYTCTRRDLRETYDQKYGNKPDLGWGPKLRLKFDYYTPDDYYEATVKNLLKEGFSWADIGCGRNIFPSNPDLAEKLAQKAGYLLGVDPDENIYDNPYLDEKFKGTVDEYKPEREFDLITLRMVAEHVVDPDVAIQGLRNMARSGSLIVVYTPSKWAPMSILARFTPIGVHHFFKKLLWSTEERDTFPVQFKMNTRKRLKELFGSQGFDEVHFSYLDDCRIFSKAYVLKYLELSLWRTFKMLGLRYPEACLLGVYRLR